MQEQGSIQKTPGIILWLKLMLGIVFVLAVLSVVTVSIKSTQIPDSLLIALPIGVVIIYVYSRDGKLYVIAPGEQTFQ